MKRKFKGASLIELLIGLLIAGILASIAVPSFVTWVRNTEIKSAAEGILSGLQLAKSEAVSRNTAVRLTLGTGSNWAIGCVSSSSNCPATIQEKLNESGNSLVITTTPTVSSITFNGLGRQANNAAAVTFRIESPSTGACLNAGGNLKCMQVRISSGGQIRMCDPSLPSSNSRGC